MVSSSSIQQTIGNHRRLDPHQTVEQPIQDLSVKAHLKSSFMYVYWHFNVAQVNISQARYRGNEYAFGQVKAGISEDANKDIIRGEYENLVDASNAATLFKEELRRSGIMFPSKQNLDWETVTRYRNYANRKTDFYFNLEGSFVGELLDWSTDKTRSPNEPPEHKTFIATPLLPCGPANGPIIKYTGNDNVGAPPAANDTLTALLHAYTHFTFVYTKGHMVICDLQGMV